MTKEELEFSEALVATLIERAKTHGYENCLSYPRLGIKLKFLHKDFTLIELTYGPYKYYTPQPIKHGWSFSFFRKNKKDDLFDGYTIITTEEVLIMAFPILPKEVQRFFALNWDLL